MPSLEYTLLVSYKESQETLLSLFFLKEDKPKQDQFICSDINLLGLIMYLNEISQEKRLIFTCVYV